MRELNTKDPEIFTAKKFSLITFKDKKQGSSQKIFPAW